MKRLFIAASLLLAAFFIVPFSHAKIGVGVGTSKIQVDEKLKSGMIYKLPSISVINVGDEASDYTTLITYQQEAKELRPNKDWFIFTPQTFHLEPGKVQVVDVKINLPLSINPGNYFAYLEARPVATVKKGSTSIGVAAATKLYFTVVPANIFLGIYYKIITFWQVYAPWPERVAIALGVIVAAILFKNFFNIRIDLKKNDKESKKATKPERS